MPDPMLSIMVEPEDARHVKKVLTSDVPRRVRQLMNDAVSIAEAEARKRAKPHTVDTGETARSIESNVSQSLGASGLSLRGTVFSTKRHSVPVEFGRNPGKMPPVDAIEAWARRHGMAGAGFVIARSIARKGTKGLFFMRGAADHLKKRLPGLVKKTAIAVEKDWKRP